MQTRKDFYRSRQWRRLVLALQMERVAGDGLLYCAHCGKPIVAKYDCVAHHVEELHEANVNDAAISLNPENIVLVHHRCHNRIHERFGKSSASYLADRRVYLVYGSPCSGKSTWVRENAGRNDLVVDMDGIYEAVGTLGRYEKSGAIKQNVFAVRDLLIDQIRTRYGKWQNAYIVGGYPLLMDRVRLMDSAGAECIFIDTPRHISLSKSIAKNFYADQIKAVKADYADKIEQVFKDAAKQMKKAGENAISGFIAGLTKKAKESDGAVKKAANRMVKAMNKALKIHSPSKVFEQMGIYSGMGYENGLTESLRRAQASLASAIQPQMNGGTTGGAAQQTAPVTYNFYQTNNSPKSLSRLEIYRQTRNQLALARG